MDDRSRVGLGALGMKVPERPPPVDTAHVAAGAAIDAVTQTIPGDQQVAAAGVIAIDLRSRRVGSIAPNVFEAGGTACAQ